MFFVEELFDDVVCEESGSTSDEVFHGFSIRDLGVCGNSWFRGW